MLVLTRKIGESIIIDNDIKFTIIGIKGNQIRLGFEAPLDVEIHRQEIWEKIQQESKSVLLY